MRIYISKIIFITVSAILVVCVSCEKKSVTADYPVQPVPFTSVKLTDKFWSPRIKRNALITIPIAFGYCESTGRIKNFEIAGGLDTGIFQTMYPFDDSDVFKIIEGASYSLQTLPDPMLDAYLDTLIWKIGLAQEDDGYLYTNRTIAEMHNGRGIHEWAGRERWKSDSILSHELYNIGHLYEAAVAHAQATGKHTLLDIALKSAGLVNREFGWGKERMYPGHQEIELGLIRLYRFTGDERYLNLARFFLDIRGPGGENYNQAHRKPVDQSRAVGHSVRATYMYSAMADMAAIMSDDTYLEAVKSLWEDIVKSKIYITGGIGASGGNEGFSDPFALPNISAYCETCASIGEIFFNERLFLLLGNSVYVDLLEKILYNSMLSSVSLSADRFLYANPLESDGQYERSEWFGCACCPSNISRFLPSIPGYIYGVSDDDLYVNLFISNDATLNIAGREINMTMETNYPWDNRVGISVNPETRSKFNMKIRIPGWALNEAIPGDLYKYTDMNNEDIHLLVNGENIELIKTDGYAIISRTWRPGDKVEIIFPMKVRRVIADARIKEDTGKVVIQRGPIIYCAEWPDNNTGNILNMVLNRDPVFTTEFIPSLLGGVEIIRTSGYQTVRTMNGKTGMLKEEPVTLIPYAFWNNRGPGQMRVWLSTGVETTRPLPAPTIAFRSRVRASTITKELEAVKDQVVPTDSNDRSVLYYYWLPKNDRWEWIEYDFQKPVTISKTKIYWVVNGPDGTFSRPGEWEILYLTDNIWEPVKVRSLHKETKENLDIQYFEPVKASAIKIKVNIKKDSSVGIYEWVID